MSRRMLSSAARIGVPGGNLFALHRCCGIADSFTLSSTDCLDAMTKMDESESRSSQYLRPQ